MYQTVLGESQTGFVQEKKLEYDHYYRKAHFDRIGGFSIQTFLYVGSYHNSGNTAYKAASCQIAIYFYG